MKRGLHAVALGLLMLLGAAPASHAQVPPVTHPSDERKDVAMGWDRSSMAGDVQLWMPKTVLGYSTDTALNYGALHLTCESDSNPDNGKCPSVGIDGGYGVLPIWLTFVEQRSGLRTELRVDGYLNKVMPGRRCSVDHWAKANYPLWSSTAQKCADEIPIGTAAALWVSESELNKLVAGRWRAAFELDLHSSKNGPVLSHYVFTFDFTVTDYNAAAIYFPAFDQITPHVGLNLHYDPIAQNVGGRALLDMCLYDGVGSQIDYLGLTVRDIGSHTPGETGFSVWHQDGGVDDSRRLDYQITVDHAGTAIGMKNGVEQRLASIDPTQLRLVILPGMTHPVYCVPSPLTLVTPRVPITSKRPGPYTGDLQVELRVPSSTP